MIGVQEMIWKPNSTIIHMMILFFEQSDNKTMITITTFMDLYLFIIYIYIYEDEEHEIKAKNKHKHHHLLVYRNNSAALV